MGIIVQTVLLSFFFSSYFLEALSSDNYSSNAVYTLQEKYFWALLRIASQLRLKWLYSGPKHICAHKVLSEKIDNMKT